MSHTNTGQKLIKNLRDDKYLYSLKFYTQMTPKQNSGLVIIKQDVSLVL